MILRQLGALEAFMRFLVQHLHRGRIGTLSINDTRRMVRLVLDTNCFAYQDKYYLQIRGGAIWDQHLHVGMGTVLGRTTTGNRCTLWPVSTAFSL